MTELKFTRDGWLDGDVGDADECATFTRLKIIAGDAIITRNFSKRGGGETEALNLPLFPLAEYIAKLWWPLLYEPFRARKDASFLSRHRLDLPMHGYVFPALGIGSAGDNAVLAQWSLIDNPLSPLKFLALPPREPLQISREHIEPELMDLVESTLARLKSRSAAHQELGANWQRVRESLENPDQASYCMAAGRLGIDPYDPDAPDISQFLGSLPEDLFNDISEATNLPNLGKTAESMTQASRDIDNRPTIDVTAFGEPPRDDLRISAGELGYKAAVTLRNRLGFADRPTKVVKEVLAATADKASVLNENGPPSMAGLSHRTNGVAHVGTFAKSARQRHFRAAATAYIAWCSRPGDVRAGTVALTRRQQASRAFAAEIVAPQSYLLERGEKSGFTDEDIEEEAGKLVVPYATVLWQAWRAGVPLLGVDTPLQERNTFF
jgi:hypothetical protein